MQCTDISQRVTVILAISKNPDQLAEVSAEVKKSKNCGRSFYLNDTDSFEVILLI